MKLPKLIFDILSNPDNLTFSSKRVAGFISLFTTIVFGYLKLNEPMIVMAGLTTAFFGLSTLDYSQFLSNKPNPIDDKTGNTPVNP